ncbi:hypothetical protein ABMA27_013594 [Loxostege sticticalis]|uniref:BPTI/Kunitz inhibitor domain-containing protein n=1 Tax=Loxostege sticticalis TaxID=481309 RepID=A0ABR3IFU8_LOXSC
MNTLARLTNYFFVISPISIYAVPPDICFEKFRSDDCGASPISVIYYWQPSSKCEVGIWRGCLPNLNMFPDEYTCINTCIYGKRAGSNDYAIYYVYEELAEPEMNKEEEETETTTDYTETITYDTGTTTDDTGTNTDDTKSTPDGTEIVNNANNKAIAVGITTEQNTKDSDSTNIANSDDSITEAAGDDLVFADDHADHVTEAAPEIPEGEPEVEEEPTV